MVGKTCHIENKLNISVAGEIQPLTDINILIAISLLRIQPQIRSNWCILSN